MSEQESGEAKIIVENGQLVLPGDLLAEGHISYDTIYIYSIGDKHYSSISGIVEVRENKLNITPIEQAYIPRPNDIVIGIVTEIGNTYWILDINSPYEGQLPVGETQLKQPYPIGDIMRKYLNIGDYVLVKIIAFNRNRDPLLSMKGPRLGKINKGKIIDYNISSLRALLTKGGREIVGAIAKETGTDIFVASNGRIWVSGPTGVLEDIAVLTLKNIERRGSKLPAKESLINFIREEKSRRGV